MAHVASWGWYAYGQVWPGFSLLNNNNLNHNGDGKFIDPAGYVEVTLNDYNNDGVIYDADLLDGLNINGGETVTGANLTLTPFEVALYSNSSIVMNGQTITGLSLEVTLFTDGSYGVRLLDSQIPAGHHSSVTSVQLGTWNGVEYSGVTVSAVDQMFVCFVEGTMIQTARGMVPVQQLKIGDQVETMDHGLQPIRWIGSQTVLGVGKNAPVRFDTGVLDNEVPVYLSPNHRVLVQEPSVEILYGVEEVLITAKHLVNGENVRSEPRALVTYYNFACDQHEIVLADGMPAETLYPGPQALEMISAKDRERLLEVFPVLRQGWHLYGPAARTCLTAREAELFRWASTRANQLAEIERSNTRQKFVFA